MTEERKKLILAITGASGAVYGVKALELLKKLGVEVHLVISKAGERTLQEEMGMSAKALKLEADVAYPSADIGARIASGSFKTMGMLVAPCSVRSMSEIASGISASLVSRAADVILKERRRLVLMLRETPLHTGHLRTMTLLSEMGAVIMPPVPAFYTKPQSLDDMVHQSVGRALDLFGLDCDGVKRWQSEA